MAQKIAAVLTTQFLTSTDELTVRSLKAVLKLPIRKIIVVTDEKEPNGRYLAEQGVQSMAAELRAAGTECDILSVNCYSTARRWWPAICNAFADDEITAILNFPADLKTDISDEQLRILSDAIQVIDSDELVLFDYKSNDPFKEAFDELFLTPLLRVGHPGLIDEILKLNHSKLRTEFFGLGRKPFTSLKENLGVSWGTDPTIQLLINSLKENFKIRSVHFGRCQDDANTRDTAGKSLQIVRVGHQILNDAIISSTRDRRDKSPVTSKELLVLSKNIHEEIYRCLRRNQLMTSSDEKLELSGVQRRVRIATHVVGGSSQRTNDRSSTLERIAETLLRLIGEKPSAMISVLVLVQPDSSVFLDQQARGAEKCRWEDEAKRLNDANKYPSIEVVFDMEHTPYQPATLAWRMLYRNAFHAEQPADAVLYIDLNVSKWPSAHIQLFKPRFQRMLKAAQDGNDLILGDYRAVVPLDNPDRQEDVEVKYVIEKVVKQMLREAYPDLFRGWELFEALDRPRTEFHALSRKLYAHLGKKPHGAYDYGLFLLVVARLCGLRIERIDLGDLPEVSRNSASKIVDQISRVRFQIDAMRNYHRMLNPVNPKVNVLGLETQFAPFKGYSLLFDNPDETYANRDGLSYVDCRGANNPLFYRTLFESLEAIDVRQLRIGFSFCPLTAESAHCTVLDGHNPENVDQVHPDHRERIAGFIHALPGSMRDSETTLHEFYSSKLVTKKWPIAFVFEELAIWGGNALVAKLRPADDASLGQLAELKKARLQFAHQANYFGLHPKEFTPHISLGYFADPQLGERAEIQLPYWTSVFEQRLGATRLAFHSVTPHAFSNMVNFYRVDRAGARQSP